MYVMGNYPKCYTQVNAREYPSVLKDSRVFWVANRTFRQGATNKTKSYEKDIEEIKKMISEVEELKELMELSPEEQMKRLEEAEETELEERRKNQTDGEPNDDDEVDDPEDALMASERESAKHTQYAGTYHALEYHIGAIESDRFMEKLKGNYKVSESGDSFLELLGASND